MRYELHTERRENLRRKRHDCIQRQPEDTLHASHQHSKHHRAVSVRHTSNGPPAYAAPCTGPRHIASGCSPEGHPPATSSRRSITQHATYKVSLCVHGACIVTIYRHTYRGARPKGPCHKAMRNIKTQRSRMAHQVQSAACLLTCRCGHGWQTCKHCDTCYYSCKMQT